MVLLKFFKIESIDGKYSFDGAIGMDTIHSPKPYFTFGFPTGWGGKNMEDLIPHYPHLEELIKHVKKDDFFIDHLKTMQEGQVAAFDDYILKITVWECEEPMHKMHIENAIANLEGLMAYPNGYSYYLYDINDGTIDIVRSCSSEVYWDENQYFLWVDNGQWDDFHCCDNCVNNESIYDRKLAMECEEECIRQSLYDKIDECVADIMEGIV